MCVFSTLDGAEVVHNQASINRNNIPANFMFIPFVKRAAEESSECEQEKKKRNMQQKLLEQHKNLFLWAKIDDEKSSVSCGRRVTAIEATQTTNAWLVKCADWNGFTFSHTLRGFFCCCYVLLAPFSSAENSVEVSLSLSFNDNSVISAR